MFGGLGADTEAESATKSASCSIWSARLKRRSKPIVEEPFELIALPQSEPATWPGKTSTPSGSSSSRRSDTKRSAGSLLRADGEIGPRGIADEERVAGEHEPRLVAARAVDHRERVCSGRWPGVWIARSTTSPSAISAPSSSGSKLVLRLRGRVDRDRQPCSSASRPWPETWSACVCVSIVRDDPHPARRGLRQHALDRVGRVDDRCDARVLVADQVRRTAEVVVNELLEQHET